MGSQLLQNTEILALQKYANKLTYYLGKSEENMDLSRIYLAVLPMQNLERACKLVKNPQQFCDLFVAKYVQGHRRFQNQTSLNRFGFFIHLISYF